MMIGMDLPAMFAFAGVEPEPLHLYPMNPGIPSVYTPLEELPAETQLLYDYNPELARQMLADEGYPDGFAMQFTIESRTPEHADRASLIRDIWSKIGVEVEINLFDSPSYNNILNKVTYHGAIEDEIEAANPTDTLVRRGTPGGVFNYSKWENEQFTELLERLVAERDVDEQNRLCKEGGVLLLNEVSNLPLYPSCMGTFWWPWVKNFFGERAIADKCSSQLSARVWIDQDLKKEMGY